MPTVTGIISNADGSHPEGFVVQAFDIDLYDEQRLGEDVIEETSGRYAITFSEEQFRRHEKKCADLVVRVFDPAGNRRAESDIFYNECDDLRVDLIIEPLPEPEASELSELEHLLEAIDSLADHVEYATLTDRQVTHVVEELARQERFPLLARLEKLRLRQQVECLRRADQFARESGILLAAFYGWCRMDLPDELNVLLDLPLTRLREALEQAIAENIIPDITAQISETLERLRALRFERGRFVQHRFVAQLIGVFGDGTEQPLAGHLVDVVDPDAEDEEQQSGTVQTDGRGIFVLTLTLPADAPDDARRQLQLTVRDEETTIAETVLEVQMHQDEVAQIRVQVREPELGAIDIAEIASPELAARLRQREIFTLRDLLNNPDVREDDFDDFERLRGHAKFAVLAPELEEKEREVLLEKGYASLLDVAGASRAEFVREHHAQLGGDARAYITREAAMAYHQIAQHMKASAWFKIENDDDPEDPDIPTDVNGTLRQFKKCGCKDCDSAVSPAAYLAHLLAWTLEHIKDVQDPITLSQLESEFHQPFGELPVTCKAVEEQVRQVRICIEVLWRFTDFLELSDLQMPTSYRSAYRHLRNQLYLAILTNLGANFAQLRKATLAIEGDSSSAELVASHRKAVANALGIDEAHLGELFVNVEQPGFSPSEADLERLFGFKSTRHKDVFTVPGRPELVKWQRERLEAIWETQDWSIDDYRGEGRLPFVDPAIIDSSYLRTPLNENPASALLENRQATLAVHRQEMMAFDPQQNGLADLVDEVLGESVGALRDLYETLQSTDSTKEQIEEAHATVDSLHLTQAGFSQLMQVDAIVEAGEALGATNEEVEAAWATVFDVLSRAHRHSLFQEWVDAEEQLELILGPKLFWFPVQPTTPPSSWQASAAERAAWDEALRRRSRRPLIDPDQISFNYLTIVRLLNALVAHGMPLHQVLVMPPLRPVVLWQERRTFIHGTEGRLATLEAARQGQPTAEASLQAMLAASTLGINLELFEELATLEESGEDLEPRLAQLSLSLREYRFLADVHLLAQANAPINSGKWREVSAILVAAEKRREYAEWRLEEEQDEAEAGGITLHPIRFRIPGSLKPVEDSSENRWLHDPLALQQWSATLAARNEQFDALDEALASAVGDAEEAVLPLLRNILMMQTVAPGATLAEKADWLDKRLLVDTHMAGCQMTTRVGQAIETLQRFIRGVYTEEHLEEEMEHLTLDAVEDYETEWPVLGSYATWRAFMLAYLYPENLLHLSPPRSQSFGFTRLKEKLPGQVIPANACIAADDYASYFRDIGHLEVQASCQVGTRVVRETGSGCEGVVPTLRSRVHLFALATTSGRVYTTSFDGYFDAADTLDTWRPVDGLINVIEIIGAVPHETSKQQRLILLFVKVRQESKTSLMVVSLDLDSSSSWNKPFPLDLPPGAGSDFSAVAMQKRHGGLALTGGALGLDGGSTIAPATADSKKMPTILAIRAPDGRVYMRNLNASATNWAGGRWIPLFGPILAEQFAQVCALIQRSSDEYLMIVRAHDGWLKYRIFSIEPVISKDDGFWRKIAKGEYAGAFSWPGTPDIFVYYRSGGRTEYAIIRRTGELFLQGLQGTTRKSIPELDDWLQNTAGVSLAGFETDISVTMSFNPRLGTKADCETAGGNSLGSSNRPLGVREVEFSYRGNLLDLLTLTEDEWEDRDRVPSGKCYFVFQGAGLRSLQKKGLKAFVDEITQIDGFQSPLKEWKLADIYVKQFAIGNGVGLAVAVANAFDGKATEFRVRVSITEVSLIKAKFVGIESNDQWDVIFSGGDEEFGFTPGKAIALRTPDGAFRLKLGRSNDELIAPKLRRVTPDGEGPFDLAPLSAKIDLDLRRTAIKEFYDDLADSPHSVMAYLKEAYSLVPIYLGHQLQRNGYYEEALLWYRQVYDYLQSSGKQKIDHSLTVEEKLKLSYERAEEWLDDASNAHSIAATRENTYTRHILLMIIRCLIEYADALFSHDTVTDNARARELYSLALKLLDSKALKPGKSRCADIIGSLEVEVVEPGQLPLQQFQAALAEIQDPDRLDAVVKTLKAISLNTDGDPAERLQQMHDAVRVELAAIPAPKRMTSLLDDKRKTAKILEDHYLADPRTRKLLQKTQQRRRQKELTLLSEVTNRSEEVLLRESPSLPWLRQPRPNGSGDGRDERRLELALFNPNVPRRLAVLNQIRERLPLQSLSATRPRGFAISSGVSFDFCIPQNPVVTALRRRAENNLLKLRTCRNIAGFLRQIDPYGAPIGIGSGMVSPDGTIFSGIVEAPPTPYRYAALMARAKELVNIAQQIEAGYQTALERAEDAALSVLLADQGAEMANARVVLGDLRVNQANNELGLAQLQKGSAVLREETYAGWIAAGKNEHERTMLDAYSDAADAQKQAARASADASVAQAVANIAGAWSMSEILTGSAVTQSIALGASIRHTLDAATYQERAIGAEARAQSASFEASFERRNDEWQLQQGLAALDVQIGDQQIQLARGGIEIAQQERTIARLELTHAWDILMFLLTKNFDEEMYHWIASILEDVYRFFLQAATSIARLAERQLAFERQEGALKVIRAGYWQAPADGSAATGGNNVDRLGLTGSARLLKDIYQLDNYAFETRRLKQSLIFTLNLAEMFPFEFQLFRETGSLVVETPLSLIDRQMPGYYLCLIQQVTVSVVALIPPTRGIRATLTSAGPSRVVVGGDTFQLVRILGSPQRIALTAPTTSSAGILELEPDAQSLQRPFEGSGFDTLWELRMPKAANPFDYNTIATVLFTVELTALHSFDYERQVIEQMDRRISANRAFYFRQEFADPWFDLHNPEQSDTPMDVRFETRREDFPPNAENLRIEHVLIYFIGAGGEAEEITVTNFSFKEEKSSGTVGGGTTTVDGVISTRRGNGTSWLPMLGLAPIGEWELALPDTPEMRARFQNDECEDILLVITFGGELPKWPS